MSAFHQLLTKRRIMNYVKHTTKRNLAKFYVRIQLILSCTFFLLFSLLCSFFVLFFECVQWCYRRGGWYTNSILSDDSEPYMVDCGQTVIGIAPRTRPKTAREESGYRVHPVDGWPQRSMGKHIVFGQRRRRYGPQSSSA